MRSARLVLKARCLLQAMLAGALLCSHPWPACALSRLYFAAQDDWGAKKGFFIDVEGAKMATLPLNLAVGDGSNWHIISQKPPFVGGRRYTAKAVITPKEATLYLNGARLGSTACSFAPFVGPLVLRDKPAWAATLGDYVMIVDRVTATVEGGGRPVGKVDHAFNTGTPRPLALRVFACGPPQQLPLKVKPGDTLTVEVAFRCEAVDLHALAPLIDRYGQCRYADWPGKVRSDKDLRDDIAREDAKLAAMPPSPDYDRYGGYTKAGWTGTVTGFFHVTKHEGKWWLITPKGNPCFFVGCDSAPNTKWPTTPVTGREYLFDWLPPHTGAFAECWAHGLWGHRDDYVCFNTANLIRKFGADWIARETKLSVRRLRCWGFSGAGKWGGPPGLVETPDLTIGATPRITNHPDVFDPKVRAIFAREIEKQIAPRLKDPLVLGWSLGNEDGETVRPGEIAEIMGKPADVPAKRALLDYGVDKLYGGSVAKAAAAWKVTAADRQALYATTPKLPPADTEALRRDFQDKYWGFIYTTIKRLDPNHLYLGSWIGVGGPSINAVDWRILARHCDVIGFDRYRRTWNGAVLSRLEKETNKPIYDGEFCFPGLYRGLRGFGRLYDDEYSNSDAEEGELYYKWVQAAAADPYCVGMSWFQYRDEPLTGEGPPRGGGFNLVDGEDFAFGLITEQDRPKWDMVTRMREANLAAARWRLQPGG